METVLRHYGTQQAFHIGEPSEIAAVRRAGTSLAQRLGFNEVRAGELAIVITEAATNIVKHARQGEILIRSVEQGNHTGVEVIAIDAGPGISNIKLQMEDGHSTVGTYGVGLGAIKRLTQEFDIYSLLDQGTALLMIVWAELPPKERPLWQVGAICIPLAGEYVCGDAWITEADGYTLTLLVADGLGHGPDAAQASNAAIRMTAGKAHTPPGLLLPDVHTELRGTRGAAVAIAQIDLEAGQLRFAGVGNIAVSVFEKDQRRHLLSHNGIVGSNLRKLQEFNYPWQTGALLIAHSDGMGTRWDLERYPGLVRTHPSLIAAVLYRDFKRGNDDFTLVVIREMAGF